MTSSLPQAASAQRTGNAVDAYQQHEVDHVVEQTDGCRITELRLLNADFVDVGGNQLGVIQIDGVLQKIGF